MPKDYLNKEERDNLVYLYHSLSLAENILKSNSLTKEEETHIKKSITWGNKALDTIIKRLNPTAFKVLSKYMSDTKIYLEYNKMADIYIKKKSNDIKAAHEENKEYFKLIELIMFYNCRNCTKNPNECEFYEQFEINLIPDPGFEQIYCKYSYVTIEE